MPFYCVDAKNILVLCTPSQIITMVKMTGSYTEAGSSLHGAWITRKSDDVK